MLSSCPKRTDLEHCMAQDALVQRGARPSASRPMQCARSVCFGLMARQTIQLVSEFNRVIQNSFDHIFCSMSTSDTQSRLLKPVEFFINLQNRLDQKTWRPTIFNSTVLTPTPKTHIIRLQGYFSVQISFATMNNFVFEFVLVAVITDTMIIQDLRTELTSISLNSSQFE